MVGNAGQVAARGRHHVDVGVAVVVAAECDAAAVGREAGERLLPGRGAQSSGRSAALLDHPDVAGVDEGDVRVGDVRIAEHAGVDLRPGRGRA